MFSGRSSDAKLKWGNIKGKILNKSLAITQQAASDKDSVDFTQKILSKLKSETAKKVDGMKHQIVKEME